MHASVPSCAVAKVLFYRLAGREMMGTRGNSTVTIQSARGELESYSRRSRRSVYWFPCNLSSPFGSVISCLCLRNQISKRGALLNRLTSSGLCDWGANPPILPQEACRGLWQSVRKNNPPILTSCLDCWVIAFSNGAHSSLRPVHWVLPVLDSPRGPTSSFAPYRYLSATFCP